MMIIFSHLTTSAGSAASWAARAAGSAQPPHSASPAWLHFNSVTIYCLCMSIVAWQQFNHRSLSESYLIECHSSAENAGLVLVQENVEVLEAALAAHALTACVTGGVRAREHRRVLPEGHHYFQQQSLYYTVTGMVCFLISPPYAAASYVLLQRTLSQQQ